MVLEFESYSQGILYWWWNCAAKVLFSRCWGLSTRVEDHKDVLLIHRTRHNTRDTRLANTLKHAHILAGSLHTPLQQLLKIQIRGHKTSKAVFPFSCHFTEKQAADAAILCQYIPPRVRNGQKAKRW